ncbi:MAG: S1 RNA-binding domain-containing protein [Clostridia bacterium]|nr:S1 RNA-binding domain-containing protein [Clostridia bacterium]
MELKIGEIYEGKITGITNFGVFVDLGDNTSGMVHISQVARSFVNDINEHVKMGETVKVKVMSIGEDGKIALSIKEALEPEKRDGGARPRERKPRQPQVIDSSYTWTSKKNEPEDFEDMMNRFKQTSDEKFSDLKRKNPETRRSKRGANVR